MKCPSSITTPDPSALSPGPADDPALQAWRQMAITFIKLQRRLEQMLAPHGLALSQFEALAKLGVRPGLIQQDLSQALLLTKGNIGALVDRLEGMALLERRPDADDKRVNRLYLTPGGKRLVGQLFGEHLALVRDMMNPLSPAQQGQMRALLQLIEPE